MNACLCHCYKSALRSGVFTGFLLSIQFITIRYSRLGPTIVRKCVSGQGIESGGFSQIGYEDCDFALKSSMDPNFPSTDCTNLGYTTYIHSWLRPGCWQCLAASLNL